jgi:two-component system, OmpR family, response regulator QseB
MRVLVVEDEEGLGDMITRALKQDGYAVDWLKDGLSADQALRSESFDIVVLDLMLPRLSGLTVLKNFRDQGKKTPVIVLTAKDTIKDKVLCLDAGADDFLTKPFSIEELYARLRALSRRSGGRPVTVIKYHGIELDPVSHAVTNNGELLNIPRREFALLQKLLENQGKALSREQLNQSLYSWDEDVDSNALEVHIHNLRKKFGSTFIRTIRGVGYIVEKIADDTLDT